MNTETLFAMRLPLPPSNQIYTEERADLTTRDFPERALNLRETINNNPALSNINNAWRESFAGDRAVKPKFYTSQSLPPNLITVHCEPEGIQSREAYPSSISGNHPPMTSPNALEAVAASPIVQNLSPEIHPRSKPPQDPVPAIVTSHKNHIVQSSLLDIRSIDTPNALQILTACSGVQQSQEPSQDYGDPRKVPGTDQNIYPRARISKEFHERYPQLIDFFKQAVDAHKFLKYHTSKINYELRLCGSAPPTAIASIIIFCAEVLFKDLRSLLNSKHIRRQYQPIKHSLRDKFQFTPSKTPSEESAPIIAPFKIIFWREATTPTKRKSAMERVATRNNSDLTMCGSLVSYGDRTSTLGLLITVDSNLYGLTVDHLFKSQRGEVQPIIESGVNILPNDDSCEDNQVDSPWIDDVTYQDIENDGSVSDNGSTTSGGPQNISATDQGVIEHCGSSINGRKVDSLHMQDSAMPYLDWALIEFDNGYYERPNAFYSDEDPGKLKFLKGISEAPQTSEVNVFMISGASGTRKGVILDINSYIGGNLGEELCQVWNVILSDSGGVIDGDCGSLIVDQMTLEVYGHVIASNPLGEAYVVPLRNTFHQISNALGAKNVSLPHPEPVMENLIKYYSKASNMGILDEATISFSSIEGTGNTGNQHDVRKQAPPVFSSRQSMKWNDFKELDSLRHYSVLIKHLHPIMTEDKLRSMAEGLNDFVDATVLLPEESEDHDIRSAILNFNSKEGALEATNMFGWNTKVASDTCLVVEEVFDSHPGLPPSVNSFVGPGGPSLGKTSSIPMMSKTRLRQLKTPLRQSLRQPPNRSSVWGDYLGQIDFVDLDSETNQHSSRQNLVFINPAEQNPPCNTLYIGNIPIGTSEEELKDIISKQRGYKRLCFRTKQNGSICLVEFEDVSFATKALHELYGLLLFNSIKGEIRLSFSKNPLGVRSSQSNIYPSSNVSSFSNATGPPPGLAPPPGFGSDSTPVSELNHSTPQGLVPGGMSIFTSWNKGTLTAHMFADSTTSKFTGFNKDIPPAYMFGK